MVLFAALLSVLYRAAGFVESGSRFSFFVHPMVCPSFLKGHYGTTGQLDLITLIGGALSAVRVQCARSATIWASGRTRDPYFEILEAPRGIMVTPSGGFEL